MPDDTTRINPTIEGDLDEIYKEFVGYRHNDKVKGRFSPSVETGMKAHMALYFSDRPKDLEEFRDTLDDKKRQEFNSYVQDADEEFGILSRQGYPEIDFDLPFDLTVADDAVFGEVVDRCLEEDYSGAWAVIDGIYDDSEPEHEALGAVVQALR